MGRKTLRLTIRAIQNLPGANRDTVYWDRPQAAIEYCAPNLLASERLINPSSSAGFEGLDALGLHYYTWIKDGTQAKQVLQTLHKRAWLLGLGWIKVHGDGRLDDWSLFDKTVYSAERQIFEAAPIVHPPLFRNAPPMIVERGGLFEPEPLTTEEEGEVRRRIAEAKAELRESVRETRTTWYDQKSRASGISTAQLKKICVDQAPLPDNWLLADGRTIGEVLDECERIGEPILIHDPFSPEKGPSKASVLPRDFRFPVPILWSHADSRKYSFERYANPKAPAKFPTRGMALADGEAKLAEAFDGAAMSRRLIKATQGLGKTRAAVAAMSAFRGIAACFVRSHDNAEQLKRDFAEDVRVPSPRSVDVRSARFSWKPAPLNPRIGLSAGTVALCMRVARLRTSGGWLPQLSVSSAPE